VYEHPIDPLGLCSPSAILGLMREHRIRPSKHLGQHFIIDRNALRRIVNAAQLQEDDHVLEIGTGFGTLTAALAVRCKTVVTVERDKKLARIAEELLSPFGNVRVIANDFVRLGLPEALEQGNGGHTGFWKVIGNLPYYATKPILMKILSHRSLFGLCVLTVQREVAERIASSHGTRAYGILSIAAQLFSDVELLFDISPNCFLPPPKVTSKVVRLHILKEPRYELPNEALFFDVVGAAFSERRKRIINSLSSHAHKLGLTREQIESALRSAGIDPSERAEHVSIASFVNLAWAIQRTGKSQAANKTKRFEG